MSPGFLLSGFIFIGLVMIIFISRTQLAKDILEDYSEVKKEWKKLTGN